MNLVALLILPLIVGPSKLSNAIAVGSASVALVVLIIFLIRSKRAAQKD
jgi:hypothetical protein